MLSEFGIVKSAWSRWTSLVVAAGFAACVDDAVTPAPEATPPAKPPRVLGFAELTFSGIGTPEFSSSLIVAPTLEALEQRRAQRDRSGDVRDLVTEDLTIPDDSGGGGDGTIQIAQPQRSAFVYNNIRLVRASFNIRNAQADGTRYDTPRNNLTFLAVSTSSAINETAVSKLEIGGTPAPAPLALLVLPTARVELNGDSLTVPDPDVVQVLTEAEVAAVAAIAPAAVTTVFPYGFVVRRVGDNTTRTLPASPAPGQFDGVVDFAFRLPSFTETLSVLMLAVDDSETRLTQSLEQQTAAAQIALQQRDSTLGADTVTLLPGGSIFGVSALRTLCSVRTAGPAGAATAHLVNVDWTFQSFSPTPGSSIATNADFAATFSAPVDGAGPHNFTVRGLQSGPAFQGQPYTTNGATVTTPTGSFSAGEEVEVAVTNALSCQQPAVARYPVQTIQSPGTFSDDTTYGTGVESSALAIGDLDGTGSLDVAVTNETGNGVSILLNQGNGTFPQTNPSYDAGFLLTSVATGDLDGNGSLDLAVGDALFSSDVYVLLNAGDGTFPGNNPGYDAGPESFRRSVAIGELNGDGRLDIAATNENGVAVLLNYGDGTFPATNPSYGAGAESTKRSVAIGDLDGDNNLDLAVTNPDGGEVFVLLNNGDGTFPANNPSYAAGETPYAVAIGDLDATNGPDIVVADSASANVSVLLNQGTGTFPATNPTYAVGQSPQSVAIGDVDGMNGPDLAVTNVSGDISILLNSGSGTFPTNNPTTYTMGSFPRSGRLGDLDGNGVLDVVAVNYSESARVRLGQTP